MDNFFGPTNHCHRLYIHLEAKTDETVCCYRDYKNPVDILHALTTNDIKFLVFHHDSGY